MKVFHRQIWVRCCDIIFQITNSNQNIAFICEKNKMLMKSVFFFKSCILSADVILDTLYRPLCCKYIVFI